MNYGMKRIVAAAGCLVLKTTVASATVVTVPALQDATIFGTSAGADTGNASGKGPAMFVGADGSSNRKRSLIEFDVASANIPANATITGVTMTLYLAQVAGSGGSSGGGSYPSRTIGAYDLLQSWGEGGSGSPTSPGVGGSGQGYARQAGDSTWDYAFYNPADLSSGKWTNGTTNLYGGNFAATASATSTFTSFSALNVPFTWSSAGMVADVQAWVGGTSPNDGWLLKSDNLEDSPTSFLGFWTKDGAAANNNPGIAPSLTITYSVPEPSAALLIGGAAGLSCLLGRARRRAARR
jgi:hypothetical protein